MDKKEDLKKKVVKFRDDLKAYQKIYHAILQKERDYAPDSEIKALAEPEEKLREQLQEDWGSLEIVFRKIGAPLMVIVPSIGRPTYFFDEALSSRFDNPHKFNGVSEAIDASTKAIGLVDALSDIDFKTLNKRTPILFLSYSFKDDNDELLNQIKNFLSAYPISIATGAKPGTGSVSEKVKQLISDSDFALVVMTKDEENKDGKFTASKWVLDELAYALGKGKEIIRLLENEVEYKSGISGDAEYIRFDRKNLSEALIKLAHVLNDLLK